MVYTTHKNSGDEQGSNHTEFILGNRYPCVGLLSGSEVQLC